MIPVYFNSFVISLIYRSSRDKLLKRDRIFSIFFSKFHSSSNYKSARVLIIRTKMELKAYIIFYPVLPSTFLFILTPPEVEHR